MRKPQKKLFLTDDGELEDSPEPEFDMVEGDNLSQPSNEVTHLWLALIGLGFIVSLMNSVLHAVLYTGFVCLLFLTLAVLVRFMPSTLLPYEMRAGKRKKRNKEQA
jgi:hypothetical protein